MRRPKCGYRHAKISEIEKLRQREIKTEIARVIARDREIKRETTLESMGLKKNEENAKDKLRNKEREKLLQGEKLLE